jgi:hypothetical protein
MKTIILIVLCIKRFVYDCLKIFTFSYFQIGTLNRPRSTMDSIRVSEAPDTGSIPVEATKKMEKWF